MKKILLCIITALALMMTMTMPMAMADVSPSYSDFVDNHFSGKTTDAFTIATNKSMISDSAIVGTIPSTSASNYIDPHMKTVYRIPGTFGLQVIISAAVNKWRYQYAGVIAA